MSRVPTQCLEDAPTSQSVKFAGRFINLAKLHRQVGIDRGYVSYILSGKRSPTVEYAKRIAQGLGMVDEHGEPDVTALLTAIRERREELDLAFQRRLRA
jgi:transcriptional regulator with XRE-family HTH domain